MTMSFNNSVLSIMEELRGCKESMSRNHTNTELCAHLRERITTLEAEQKKLEDEISQWHDHQKEGGQS